MAIVEIVINSKIYQIGCEKEDKEKIKKYSKELNLRIKSLKEENPSFFLGLNDERVFLFQCLLLLSEIGDSQIKSSKVNSSIVDKSFDNMDILEDIDIKVDKIDENIKKLKKIFKT